MDKCDFFFTHAPCGSMGQQMEFLPTPASVAAWVFRWQVSPPLLLPPLPHLQICQRPLTKTWFQRPLTIETENAVGGGGAWVFRCDAILFFSFFSFSSSLQLFVSLRYRKCHGGCVGHWLCMPSCFLCVAEYS